MLQKKDLTPINKVGVGLRSTHIAHILDNSKKIAKQVGWFEVHSENYYSVNNSAFLSLLKIRKDFPISLHSVGNSLGSAQKIDLAHLQKLKKIIDIIDPFFVSDHISWGMIDKNHSNDLLPLPYNQESLQKICDNISLMQDYLQRQILIENPSAYLTFNNNEMDETDFINNIAKRSGCSLLLDINNIFVSAQNNDQFDSQKYLQKIDKKIVHEIHLAGHSQTEIFDGKNYKTILVDTHNNFVRDEVWQLYKQAIARFGEIPTLIEWDQDIPEFIELIGEAKKAKNIMNNAQKK